MDVATVSDLLQTQTGASELALTPTGSSSGQHFRSANPPTLRGPCRSPTRTSDWPAGRGHTPACKRGDDCARRPVRGSVLVLKREVGAANGSGQLRLLARELEPRGELRRDFHPFGELNPTARFLGSSMVYITLIDRPFS
jgi:hypothetical protein